MRKCLTLLTFLLYSTFVFSQTPANDDCDTAIDLGVAPMDCAMLMTFTNIDATASVISMGPDNTPGCFATVPDRDVWFFFTPPADGTVVDFTVTLLSDNTNGTGILNPQVGIYRIDGGCGLDMLAEFDCAAALDGESNLTFDLTGLTPGEPYYLRVNDFSASATPNSGEFTLCVGDFNPKVMMCNAASSTACFGTLCDSGGEDGDYLANEDCSFTICPDQFNECISIELESYNIENGFDFLTFHAGSDTNAPVISTITGSGTGNPFDIQTDSDCITIGFSSDGGVQQEGFLLNWQCGALACDSSLDDITVIPSLPYDNDVETTCDYAATFQGTACGVFDFMAGPESVFTYEAAGGDQNCYTVSVSNATAGTGILILNGSPTDPASDCVAASAAGVAAGVSFADPGTYYIVVANGGGCTDFDLNIVESSCTVDPSLEGALCNPINGCVNPDGLPTIFQLSETFTDIEIVNGVNDGCWFGVGAGNFYWFTIEAQTDGPFGFIFQAANPEEASDIDFNAWGPFTNEQACNNPEEVINLIETTQPIRSSYAGGTEPTGLVEVSPVTGAAQDPYDCDPGTISNGDDFASVIDCVEGEVYVILINDWGGQIESGQVQLDFSDSGPGVLDPIDSVIPIDVSSNEICDGGEVQLSIDSNSNDIFWSPNDGTLSCVDCPNPIATPSVSTTYTVTIDGICIDGVGEIFVEVYDVDAGPDLSVCLNEEIEIVSGSNFANATYLWEGAVGTLSCTDCPAPTVTSTAPGVYTYTVTLTSDTGDCVLTDEMQLTVFPQEAAEYSVIEDTELCAGESVQIGGAEVANNTYTWVAVPADEGFPTNMSNPTATPTETTIYYLEATNVLSGCVFPSVDSVLVTVYQPVTVDVEDDISICQGDEIVLSTLEPEDDVVYSWSPTAGILGDVSQPNVSAIPTMTTTYELTATRGACSETTSMTVEVNEISIEITAPTVDSTGICLGESVDITANAQPAGIEVNWAPTAGLDPMTGTVLTATPTVPTQYIATVEVPGCTRMDTLFIDVDSLPTNMDISPLDTLVCLGEIVILQSQTYEPASFPGMTHQWSPEIGFESPDSLYNMVIMAGATTTYERLTVNGFCEQVDTARVEVIVVNPLELTPVDPVICAGDEVQIMVTSPDPEITEFMWTENPALSCDDCPDPVATPSSTMTFMVEGVTDNECPPMGSILVEVVPEPMAPSGNSLCTPQIIQVNNGGSTNPDFVYSWTSADGTFNSTEPNPTFDLQENTTFSYSIDNGICEPITGDVTFSIADDESVVINGDLDVCEGQTVTLFAETSAGNGVGNLLWSNGETNEAIMVTTSGLYSVIFTPNDNCPDATFEAEVNVTVNPLPSITASHSPDTDTLCIYVGQELTLNSETDITGGTYQWTGQGGESIGSSSTVTLPTPNPGFDENSPDGLEIDYAFTVMVTNEFECSSEATTNVCIINSTTDVPNVFTPNGDEVNDTFYPFVAANQEIQSFQVFNRWGQKVFDAIEDGLDEWDGMYKMKIAPADVYVYVLELVNDGNGEVEVRKGSITLVR